VWTSPHGLEGEIVGLVAKLKSSPFIISNKDKGKNAKENLKINIWVLRRQPFKKENKCGFCSLHVLEEGRRRKHLFFY